MPLEYRVGGHLPIEANNIAVQVLGADHSDINVVQFTASADTVAIPTGAEIVEISSSEDCFINWDTTATTSTAAFFPKGSTVYKLLTGQSALSVISNGVNGTLTIVALK